MPFDAPVVRPDDVALFDSATGLRRTPAREVRLRRDDPIRIVLDIEFDGIADRAGESEEDEQRSLDAVRTAVEGFVEDVCQRCRAEGLDVRSDAPLGGSITDPGLGPRR